MNRSTISRAFVGAATSAAFLWTLALSASPQLHERIHSDANSVDHSCVVTIVAAGKFNHAPPSAASAPHLTVDFLPNAELSPVEAASLFLLTAVFEHAPPANS